MSTATRQHLAEFMQIGRVMVSSLIAIAVGLVSVSYGVSSLGLDSLRELWKELGERRRAHRATEDQPEVSAAAPLSA